MQVALLRTAAMVIQALQGGPRDTVGLQLEVDVLRAMLEHCDQNGTAADPLTAAYRHYLVVALGRAAQDGTVDHRSYLHAAAALAAEVQLATLEADHG